MSLPSPDELRERLALSRTFKYKGSRLASSEREAATTEASQFDTWQEFEVGPALENPLGIATALLSTRSTACTPFSELEAWVRCTGCGICF